MCMRDGTRNPPACPRSRRTGWCARQGGKRGARTVDAMEGLKNAVTNSQEHADAHDDQSQHARRDPAHTR